MSANQPPIHEIRVGRVRASIWANRGERSDAWFSVSITRQYRTDDGWKETASFGRDDLPIVAKITEMAYAWIWNQSSSRNRRQEVT